MLVWYDFKDFDADLCHCRPEPLLVDQWQVEVPEDQNPFEYDSMKRVKRHEALNVSVPASPLLP